MKTVEIQCATAGCGHSPFPISAQFEQRARRTHERFYCPAGHTLYFGGKSEEEKLRDELKRVRWRLENYEEAWRRADRESKLCPWPTCRSYVYASRSSLYDHMHRIHGMPSMAEVREAS